IRCLYFLFTDFTSSLHLPLCLHDALPIFATSTRVRPAPFCESSSAAASRTARRVRSVFLTTGSLIFTLRPVRPLRSKYDGGTFQDRKSTRLNSSHVSISYAVFCLKQITML